jgi:TFIIF-interacting CTD phosphatase-like protein
MAIYRTYIDFVNKKPLTDKCIILDLDETLVHTQESMKKLDVIINSSKNIDIRRDLYLFPLYNEYSGKHDHYIWGTFRPGVKDFLLFAFNYFKVVTVWSAGDDKYVENIVNYLFRDIKMPHYVYARSKCDIYNGYNIKPITKMMSEVGSDMNLRNTFIVDDRDISVITNKDNGIIIPAYEPKSLRNEDSCLEDLRKWLMKDNVIKCKDIRTLDKDIWK